MLEEYAGGDKEFQAWLEKIDRGLVRRFGIGLLDLPDWHWHDAYQDEVEWPQAMIDFIQEEMHEEAVEW